MFQNVFESFKKPFLKNANKRFWQKLRVFSVISLFQNSEDKAKICKEDLTEKDLCGPVKSIQIDKSPGNDELTKEFYKTFSNELKGIFVYSVSKTKEKGI